MRCFHLLECNIRMIKYHTIFHLLAIIIVYKILATHCQFNQTTLSSQNKNLTLEQIKSLRKSLVKEDQVRSQKTYQRSHSLLSAGTAKYIEDVNNMMANIIINVIVAFDDTLASISNYLVLAKAKRILERITEYSLSRSNYKLSDTELVHMAAAENDINILRMSVIEGILFKYIQLIKRERVMNAYKGKNLEGDYDNKFVDYYNKAPNVGNFRRSINDELMSKIPIEEDEKSYDFSDV